MRLRLRTNGCRWFGPTLPVTSVAEGSLNRDGPTSDRCVNVGRKSLRLAPINDRMNDGPL